jgi:hypothetical protein
MLSASIAQRDHGAPSPVVGAPVSAPGSSPVRSASSAAAAEAFAAGFDPPVPRAPTACPGPCGVPGRGRAVSGRTASRPDEDRGQGAVGFRAVARPAPRISRPRRGRVPRVLAAGRSAAPGPGRGPCVPLSPPSGQQARARDLTPGTHLRPLQLPPDAGHREHHEHGGDDQADEEHRRLPPVTPRHVGRRRRLISESVLSLHPQSETSNKFLEIVV